MTQKFSAILFSALSAALAAAPAHSFQNSHFPDDVAPSIEFRFRADAVLVLTGGDNGSHILSDLDTRFEWEGISGNGWRWGAELGLHAQSDIRREGFANTAGPAPGSARRSLATGRYRGGPAATRRNAFAIERVNIFLKTGWGEWRAGLTPGAGRVETINLPTGSAYLRVDGGPLGLGDQTVTRTENAASGFGPSLVYSTPRIIGLRASASFAPQARYCAVDICLNAAIPGGAGSASLENVFETGLSFDHTFAQAGRIEAAVNLVTGTPYGAEFSKDYRAFGARLRWSRDGFSIGVSGLTANNGVTSGDYQALALAARYDVGDWSFGGELARAEDDYLLESENSSQLTLSRLVGDRFSVTFGLHNADREHRPTPAQNAVSIKENSTNAFLELGFRY